ncbi:hypothetical protein [Hymenobacter terricola]|uniref:hypothetical protein n=1 Tax=Hymenobacter terricola TaxID=2819236 RepID=UPI001B304C63|nr:hypothetical protein [Hymenobacter terricola]
MRLRLLALSAAFALYTFQTQAQAYEPGLLVRSNGDTLRGEIENSFWVEPPPFIHFRPAPDSPSQLFKPQQLRAVRFTKGREFRYEGLPIDHAAQDKVGNLPYENRPDVHVDSLLAEVLVEGAVTLVRVAPFDKTVHYVLLSPGRPPLDLSARKYLRQTVDHAWLLTDGNNYRGQLGVYFGPCPAAYGASQKAPFTAKGLAEVVMAYNSSCGPLQQRGRNLLAQAAPRRRVAFQGGALAGVRYNRIEGNTRGLPGDCVDCQAHPFAGLYAELLQPGRAFALYGELGLSRFHSLGSHYLGYDANAGTGRYNTVEYSAWLATARLGVRYFVPLPHEQQLLFSFGYELNFARSPSTIATTGPLGTLTRDELYYASPTLLPNIGLGWRRQRLTLSLDGQLYFSSDTDSNSSPNSTLQSSAQFAGAVFFGTNFAARLGVSYRLGRNPDAGKSGPTAKQ